MGIDLKLADEKSLKSGPNKSGRSEFNQRQQKSTNLPASTVIEQSASAADGNAAIKDREVSTLASFTNSGCVPRWGLITAATVYTAAIAVLQLYGKGVIVPPADDQFQSRLGFDADWLFILYVPVLNLILL